MDKPSQTRGLRLISLHPLAGPTALSPGSSPTALSFAPPLPYFTQGSVDTLLLVADEAYKLRLYNADTHQCVSTAVGPLHSGPINSCRIFRSVIFNITACYSVLELCACHALCPQQVHMRQVQHLLSSHDSYGSYGCPEASTCIESACNSCSAMQREMNTYLMTLQVNLVRRILCSLQHSPTGCRGGGVAFERGPSHLPWLGGPSRPSCGDELVPRWVQAHHSWQK